MIAHFSRAPVHLAVAQSERRTLVGRAAAALIAAMSASAVVGSPSDADLIATCAEFDNLERRICAILDAAEEEVEADRLTEPLNAAQEQAFERIVRTPALTLPGLQAKAASFALWHSPALIPEADDWNERLQSSLLGDLLGVDAAEAEAAGAVHDALTAGTFRLGRAHRARPWMVPRSRLS